MVEHLYYIWVPSHDPCVQKGIPVYRVFVSQPGIQRIRIGQDVRVEKMIEADRSVGFARGRLRCHGHKLIPSWDDSRRNESKSLPRWNEFPDVWAVPFSEGQAKMRSMDENKRATVRMHLMPGQHPRHGPRAVVLPNLPLGFNQFQITRPPAPPD